jgi:asparagine synthase (glutamine-hydrolysing)
MCGIVGIAGAHEPEWLEAMNALQRHRGPDDAGVYEDPVGDVGVASTRLSVIDLADGRQPMQSDDGLAVIVFNGEIYNAPELRAGLEAQGCRFHTDHSDTELLLQLYRARGEAMLEELNGMFAFVINDRARRRLFGARDRLGIKPFYYLEQPGRFAFASELKALLAIPSVSRELDPASLYHYMSLLYIPGEATIFRAIKRLAPGHCFSYDLASRQLAVRPYWDLDVLHPESRPVEAWAEMIRSELRDALRRWIVSDVPVGCSLSGGIDSAALVGLLREIGVSDIKTYSLGFTGGEEAAWDELTLARAVARRWETDHHELRLHADELLNDLVRMVWHLDEPYGGGLPAWYVFRFMRQEVTVALTGTGGDELFGNYGKFAAFERSPLARLGVGDSWRRCYVESRYYFSDALKREAVFQHPPDGADTSRWLEGIASGSGSADIRNRIAYADIKTQLAEEFLMMTDRLSMAHSLEARVPFLDHRVVELVYRIPASVRTRRRDEKYLLKRAMDGLIPEELLRAPKRGFVLPITVWLRGRLRPMAERLLDPERLRRQGIFQPSFFSRFVEPHLTGRADHTWQVWAALMFQLWHVVFVEEQAAEAPSFAWQDVAR